MRFPKTLGLALVIAAMTAPEIDGRVVDIGSGQLASIQEIVEKLRALINPAVVPTYGRGTARGNERHTVANLAESGRLTGWAPRVGLESGLQQVVAALRQLPSP